MKKHILVVCAKRYNGHELWILLEVLQDRGYTFEVVSQDTIIRDEKTAQPNTIERVVYDVSVDEVSDFDAIVAVSGNTEDTEAYWVDTHVQKLLRAFKEIDKVCAGICCAVPILSPVVKDTKVSYFPLYRCRDILLKGGAILTNTSLTVDNKIVTAENQFITEIWATEICNVLEGKEQENIFHDSGWSPTGIERKMQPEVRAVIDEARGYEMVMVKKDKE